MLTALTPTTTQRTTYTLTKGNYPAFKAGPWKEELQYKYGDHSNNLFDNNKVVQIHAQPKEPNQADIAINAQTGKPVASGRLAYPRDAPTDPSLTVFDMDLTTAGRAAFQHDTAKFTENDRRNRLEFDASNKIDTALTQAMLALLSPQTINQLELHKGWTKLFNTPNRSTAPQRAHDLFVIMEDTFNKPDAAGIVQSMAALVACKRNTASDTTFEHLAKQKKLLEVVIQSLDPNKTGTITTTDFESVMLIASFLGHTDNDAEIRGLHIILKMPPPQPIFGRTPLLPPAREIVDTITKEISVSTPPPITTSITALIATGGGQHTREAYDPKKHCHVCYDAKQVISKHSLKNCRTNRAKTKADAPAAAATTTPTGAKALITTTIPVVADTSTSVTTTEAAQTAEIARLTALFETQKELTQAHKETVNNQQETLRSLLANGTGSI